jgi:putative membrane protein
VTIAAAAAGRRAGIVRRGDPKVVRYLYIALIVLLTAVVLAFMAQNLESVTVSFFAIRITLPLALLVVLVYFLGMVTGGALLSLLRSWIAHARSRSG